MSNKFNYWFVHEIMNTAGLLQSLQVSLTLQETLSIHDSMNIPKIEIILKWRKCQPRTTYIY